MGAPSPELVDEWLGRAFNTGDVEAAAALYHPEARVVRLDRVHGDDAVAKGAAGIREVMAGYIGLNPRMDVVVHHVTRAGDFALVRSQWLITGTKSDGEPLELHHHGMEVMRRLPDDSWVFYIDHPYGADSSWAVDRPAPAPAN
ncbi:YybH family protein [Microlunatus speluncae]|uniref:YybH family protein n=1 Tax=Microlunatus speluncae TaxID=2594267 RepID=UPI00137601E0|nr:nuclear transport factor 2 family protein [Microlunatus speluncae]